MWSLVLVFVLSLPPGSNWPEDQPLPTREVVFSFETQAECERSLDAWMRKDASVAEGTNQWALLLQSCERAGVTPPTHSR